RPDVTEPWPVPCPGPGPASGAHSPPPSAAKLPADDARCSPPSRRLVNKTRSGRSSELLLGRPQGCAELACGAGGELGLGLRPPRNERDRRGDEETGGDNETGPIRPQTRGRDRERDTLEHKDQREKGEHTRDGHEQAAAHAKRQFMSNLRAGEPDFLLNEIRKIGEQVRRCAYKDGFPQRLMGHAILLRFSGEIRQAPPPRNSARSAPAGPPPARPGRS